MSMQSTLYTGAVMHRRLRPRPHRLRYRMFWMLLDLDEVGEVARRLPAFSHNRFNLLSFHDRDHGDGSAAPLVDQVRRQLGAAAIDTNDGAIRLLCMPRILGYVFNPLSVYFCHRRDGSLAAVLYEVHNTFGERHSYLFPVSRDRDDALLEDRCDKNFHVSPFLAMGLRYVFRVAPPGDQVSIAIRAETDEGPMITAALTGRQIPLTNRALLRLFAVYPLLTLKVTGAIHWHALRMVVKGFRIYPHPARTARSAVSARASDPTS